MFEKFDTGKILLTSNMMDMIFLVFFPLCFGSVIGMGGECEPSAANSCYCTSTLMRCSVEVDQKSYEMSLKGAYGFGVFTEGRMSVELMGDLDTSKLDASFFKLTLLNGVEVDPEEKPNLQPPNTPGSSPVSPPETPSQDGMIAKLKNAVAAVSSFLVLTCVCCAAVCRWKDRMLQFWTDFTSSEGGIEVREGS